MNQEDLDFNFLIKKISNGEIILFTGSGFSRGAINYNDTEVPNVSSLKKILIKNCLAFSEKDKQYTELFELDLPLLCDYCENFNKSIFEETLKNNFLVKKVADYHKIFLSFPWKKVFTLNIDNCIELSFRELRIRATIQDSPRPKHVPHNAIELLKIHGSIENIESEIVFSKYSYHKRTADLNRDYRTNSFIDDLQKDNFLIVGASLIDELDIDIELLKNKKYVINKLFYLSPNIPETHKQILRKKFQNIVFIDDTLESFCNKIEPRISRSKKDLENSYPSVFKKILKKNYEDSNYLTPNMYIGGHPTWKDIFNDFSVNTKKTIEIVKDIENKLEEKYVFILTDKSISGKSTLLKQIGAYFSEKKLVLDYWGNNLVDDVKRINFIDNNGIIILVDNASWAFNSIDVLLNNLSEKIKFVFAIRDTIYRRKRYKIDENKALKEKVIEYTRISKIDIDDATLFIKKLKEKSYLGKYSNLSLIEAAKDFYHTTQKNDILVCLDNFSQGLKFTKRINNLISWISKESSPDVRKFVILLYFLEEYGDLPLKVHFYSTIQRDIYSMQNIFDKIYELTDSCIRHTELNSVADFELKSRYPKMLRQVVDKMTFKQKEDAIVDLLVSLSLYHRTNIINSRSYESQVFYYLIRSQNIRDIFRKSRGKIEWVHVFNIYRKTHDSLSDFHLYWLHRAISETKSNKYVDAEIHLGNATSLRNKESFEIEHTRAILYLDRATNEKHIDFKTRENYINIGKDILLNQIHKIDIHNDAYAIHSYVVKICKFYSQYNNIKNNSFYKDLIMLYIKTKNIYSLKSVLVRDMLQELYKLLRKVNKTNLLSLEFEEIKLLKIKQKSNIIDSLDRL